MGKNSLRNWPYRVVSQYLKALIRYVSEPPPLVNFNQGQFLTSSRKHYEFGPIECICGLPKQNTTLGGGQLG